MSKWSDINLNVWWTRCVSKEWSMEKKLIWSFDWLFVWLFVLLVRLVVWLYVWLLLWMINRYMMDQSFISIKTNDVNRNDAQWDTNAMKHVYEGPKRHYDRLIITNSTISNALNTTRSFISHESIRTTLCLWCLYDVYMNEDWNDGMNEKMTISKMIDVFVRSVAPIDITSGGYSGVPVATRNSLENQAWSFHFFV